MVQSTIEGAFSENYPMILIFTVVIVSIRIAYLIVHKQKFVFYREMLMLASLLYSLILFYVVTFQDQNYGTNNFIPFHEIFRYKFGTFYFIRNILGNILLFIPFGYFVSRVIETRKPYAMLIISLITSVVIETTQLLIGRTFDVDDIILNLLGSLLGFLLYVFIYYAEKKLPKVFSTDIFKNIFVVFSIGLVILLYFTSTLWGILR